MKIFISLVFYGFFSHIYASGLCSEKKFTLSVQTGTSSSEVLEEIASECSFGIVYADKQSQNILNSQAFVLRFKALYFEDILQAVADGADISYEIKDGYIKFRRLLTQTFHIDYVATSRMGSSNTDVIFSQDNQNNISQNQFYPQYLNENNPKALLLSNDQNKLSTTGTKIYSFDELNFWGDLESELYAVTYREGDSYQPVNASKNKKFITINKGAGLVVITATPSQLKRVSNYIDSLNQKIQSQVLIDVNILTISHNNIDTAGINWAEIYNLGIGAKAGAQEILSIGESGFNYGVNIFSQDLSIGKIIKFLNTYGKVSSISNPKILTLNNQPAIISVGNVLRYTQNLVYQNSTNTAVVQNTREQFPTVFSGILLDITPSIAKNSVILKINPSITSAKDSAIENEPNALKSPPNLSTNQISSVVKLQNNQKVVLGGLIHKTHSTIEKKIPILGYIPILKYLFSYKKQLENTQEIVIIITPKIITSPVLVTSKNLEDLGYEYLPRNQKIQDENSKE